MSHAKLSPSGASRWMSCTPSASFEEQFPDKSSSFAEEGTLAHKLGEFLIREKLGQISKADFKKELAEIQANELFDDSMLEYCEDYASFVMERFAEAQKRTTDAVIYLEMKLNMSKYVPEGFGTGDVVIVADGMMETIDFKYGKGVAVDVTENKQQMLYALGALDDFDFQYDIHEVRMTVYQPRINNTASWVISVKDLTKWAENELKPKAQLAFEGKGEFVSGSHCQFCKGKAVCKALATHNLELAKYDFKDSNLLTDAEVVDILSRSNMLVSWAEAVSDYALDQAVNNGKKWNGYKIVEGRANRKYSDPEKVQAALLSKGFPLSTVTTTKLLAITNLEKEIGKPVFAEIVTPFIIKPQGKPALVPASDKRPEFSSVSSAKADFAEAVEV